MKNKDIASLDAEQLVGEALDIVVDRLGEVPYGNFSISIQAAHELVDFEFFDERDARNIQKADLSYFYIITDKLKHTMYSPEKGTWLTFTLKIYIEETGSRFDAVFNYDDQPEINGEKLPLEPIYEYLKKFPRIEKPEWLI